MYNFNSRYGCQKCTVMGEYHKTMCFLMTDCPRRTDNSFRQRLQIEHHKLTSPLELLPVDMVNDFPTSDTLHLLELGVMKKCLLRWKNGSNTYKDKFKPDELTDLNEWLQRIGADFPSEIHRKARSLESVKNWKGSEFRTFLLYSGMIVLKKYIKEEEYEHFLKLCCATTLCTSDAYIQYAVKRGNEPSLAEQLFLDYIEQYVEIYGEHTITSNVHNLCHVVHDVTRFGNLNSISTYPFENSLRMIKLTLKKGSKPLQQISRRIIEMKNVLDQFSQQQDSHSQLMPQLKYPIRGTGSYSTIAFNDYRLSTKKFGDKWFLKKGGIIVEMTKAIKRSDQSIVIFGKPIKTKGPLFTKPFNSTNLNIFVSDGEQEAETHCNIHEIFCKMFCLKNETNLNFIPLLHTFQNDSNIHENGNSGQ